MKLYDLYISRLKNLEFGQFIVRLNTDLQQSALNPAQDAEAKAIHDDIIAQSLIYNAAINQVFQLDVDDTTATAHDFLSIFNNTVWFTVDLTNNTFFEVGWLVHRVLPPSCWLRMEAKRGDGRG